MHIKKILAALTAMALAATAAAPIAAFAEADEQLCAEPQIIVADQDISKEETAVMLFDTTGTSTQGDDSVVSVESDGTTLYYTSIETAFEESSGTYTVTLLGNVSTDKKIVLYNTDAASEDNSVVSQNAADVTVDLAGYTLTFNTTSTVTSHGFKVKSGSKLTIIDSSESGSGMIVSARSQILQANGGTVDVESGTVKCTSVGSDGWGLGAIAAFGTTDSTIEDYSNVIIGENATIVTAPDENGGSTEKPGYAVVVYPENYTTYDCYGVNVEVYGTCTDAYFYVYGGITADSGSITFTIGETATITGQYGIYAAGYAKWYINGATINGVASGIEIRAGELYVDGATITASSETENVTENWSGATVTGAGIAVSQHSTNQTIMVEITDSTVSGYFGVLEVNTNASINASVEVTIGGDSNISTISDDGKAVYSQNNSTSDSTTVSITGGTFDTDISDYVPDNYYTEGTGTVSVYRSNSTVYDTASAASYSVTLDGLYSEISQETTYSASENADYKVVLSDIDSSYADAVAAIKTAAGDKSFIETDISVKKYINGVEDETYTYSPSTARTVTVTLPVPASDVTVYHITDTSTYETITTSSFSEGDSTVSFTTSSFSPYILAYTPTASPTYATNVYLQLEQQTSGVDGVYNLKLYGNYDGSDAVIYRFSAAQLKFAFDDSGDYDIDNIGALDITAADGINISYQGNGEYAFYVDATQYTDCITAQSITLGTVTISGVGTYSLGLDDSYTNQAHGAETANSIVTDFVYDATATTVTGTGGLYLDGIPATGNVNLAASNMTVNVMFPNTVEQASTAYTDMTVTYSNFIKTVDVALGDDNSDVTITYDTIDADANTDGDWIGYSFTVSVPQNYTTTLTFEGAGYRTYRATIVPTSTTSSVTVWNNVMDSSTTVVTTNDDDPTTADVTFLAGDIVNNGVIDLYDLSAVVSYFGKATESTDPYDDMADYISYDLNRDGKIDSKDIAMVLVSWGK